MIIMSIVATISPSRTAAERRSRSILMTRGREETRIVPDSYVKLIYPRFYAFVYGKSEKKNEHVI